MAVKIRLTRVGSKKNPVYRVVVADSRSPRDGKFIEIIGRYNPQTDPSTIEFDEAKVKDWLAKGATPSGTVATMLSISRCVSRTSGSISGVTRLHALGIPEARNGSAVRPISTAAASPAKVDDAKTVRTSAWR